MTATTHTKYRIAYYQHDRRYLLVPAGDDDPRSPGARVLDAAEGKMYPPAPSYRILAQGYWQPYTGRPEMVDELLEGLKN